jgi:UDP-N-acetylmuramoyl-tripeptide--D-alanyl-D-alanine ligase
MPGRVHLSNALAALAVAVEWGIAREAIAPALAALRPVARRGASLTLRSGARVIDDSYNASPAAVTATIDALARTAVRGRRVAVIGEMLELGDAADTLHEACGRAAAAAGVDLLVAIGGRSAEALARGASQGGMEPAHILRFDDSAAAAEALAGIVAPNDLVLVKGSRGTRTDLVVDRLLAVA